MTFPLSSNPLPYGVSIIACICKSVTFHPGRILRRRRKKTKVSNITVTRAQLQQNSRCVIFTPLLDETWWPQKSYHHDTQRIGTRKVELFRSVVVNNYGVYFSWSALNLGKARQAGRHERRLAVKLLTNRPVSF